MGNPGLSHERYYDMRLSDDQRTAVRAEIAEIRSHHESEPFFIALWSYIPDTDDDDHLASLPARFRYLEDLAQRRLIWGSGPLKLEHVDDDAIEGMTILTVDSFDAARALLDAEPTVVRGLRTYQLFSWNRTIAPPHLGGSWSDSSEARDE